MDAPCSVMLVKQKLPFTQLHHSPAPPVEVAATMAHVVTSL
jgi:hypothetical protein